MTDRQTSSAELTALVMAAGRQGTADPVARLQDKSHKCLVEIDGVAMIERTVQTLIDSACFSRILVSIENEQVLHKLDTTRRWLENGTIKVIPSAESLTGSLARLSESAELRLPLIITTADNALHTAGLIRDFVNEFIGSDADVALAVTHESTVINAYPQGKFGFFRFRDGGYSFCNLYGIRTGKGLEAAKIFRTGGQFRKRPWRMLGAFGAVSLILYKWRLACLDTLLRRIGRRLGMQIDRITLDYPFAPIDVDNPQTFAFSEQILEQRRSTKPGRG